MTQQHGHLVGQQGLDLGQRVVAPGGDDGQVQLGEQLGERLRRGQIRLGQTQDGHQTAGVGGDQRALDQTGARRRVGQRGDDQQLVGVGDDDPLGGVVVVGGAAQQRAPIPAPHDARQRVGAAGQVTDDVDLVTDDDRGAAELAGPHRRHPPGRVATQHTAPAAPVHRHHHRFFGVGVLGAGLGPRPRAPAGAHPDIGLVVLAAAQDGWTTASLACPASMPAHSAGKSGSVLAVVAMSSTSTPGTRSPMIAPAVAIR